MPNKKVTTNLSIALIASSDPSNPAYLSGMPYSMMQVLKSKGVHIYPISPEPVVLRILHRYKLRILNMLPNILRKYLKAIKSVLIPNKKGHKQQDPELEKQQLLNRARKNSERITQLVRHKKPDVVFGCCISSLLYAFDLDIPIVYFTDATPDIINLTYPLFIQKSENYKSGCKELEKTAISKVDFAVYASQNTLNSAINDFGLDPKRGFVIPMGANIGLKDLDMDYFEAEPPTRNNLNLCIVAVDPIRKRLDLVIDTAELLKKRGWNVQLNYIGPSHPKAEASTIVNSVGQLMLTDSNDRLKMAKLISESHVMLLPSIGEAFGIAPCEAAQFGRPSVVSEAGGLKEVVQDGKTGYVLPLNADAVEYANAVERIISTPETYRIISKACQERGLSELTWDNWGDKIIPLLEEAASQQK